MGDKEYLLASGTRARLLNGEQGADWLAVAEVSLAQSGNAIIREAVPIAEKDALEIVGVTEETRAFLDGSKVRGVRVRAAGAIVLSETPVKVSGDEAVEALRKSGQGLSLFHFSEKAQNLRDRLRHLHRAYGEPWPDMDSDDLSWLDPELHELAIGGRPDMYPALQRLSLIHI